MHFYSFDLKDPVLSVGNLSLSFQVITLENVYGLDPAKTSVSNSEHEWHLQCSQLSWAGQQRHTPGTFDARMTWTGSDQMKLSIKAECDHKIRAVKVILRDLPELTLLDMLDNEKEVAPEGIIERYPNSLRLPLMFAMIDGRLTGIRNEDPHARSKRFAIFKEQFGPYAGRHAIECIHEEDARWFEPAIDVPTWIIDPDATPDDFRGAQLAFNETALGLVPWEERTDVPDWARDIRLCLTIHGMHWSGFTFNTYDQMLEIIRYAAEQINGKHILVYLPGWEGRYYWQYGDYRPDDMLGGEEGFARLCDEASALGVHVMPMFGVNCANSWAPNFHTFGPSSYMKTATRNVFHGNQPDWDISRINDTGWQAWLNPGAPAWQAELSRQILKLADRYGFDGVFLDTAEVWVNDPDFNLREGLHQLRDRLKAAHPEFLIAAEDWWDGMLDIFPLFQQTSMWRQVPNWVSRYSRLINHICDSEASRGSTGVFESGYRPYERLPNEDPYITTISFVDGTFENARDEVDSLIALAKGRI